MLKKFFSIVLLVVFANFILAPSVISLLDKKADITVFFNVNEEENKEKESEKDNKLKVFQVDNSEKSLLALSKNYNKPYKEGYCKYFAELHLPPPEFS